MFLFEPGNESSYEAVCLSMKAITSAVYVSRKKKGSVVTIGLVGPLTCSVGSAPDVAHSARALRTECDNASPRQYVVLMLFLLSRECCFVL